MNEEKRREEPSPFDVCLVAETKALIVTAGEMKVLPDYDLNSSGRFGDPAGADYANTFS